MQVEIDENRKPLKEITVAKDIITMRLPGALYREFRDICNFSGTSSAVMVEEFMTKYNEQMKINNKIKEGK